MPSSVLVGSALERMPLAAGMHQRPERIECDCAGNRRGSVEEIGSREQPGVRCAADTARIMAPVHYPDTDSR